MTNNSDGIADNGISNSSTKPYLLRAIHEWAIDNQFTPQILVAVSAPGVVVPAQYVTDGQIVLNIHPRSVDELVLGNEYLLFSARFARKMFKITIPVAAVLAIYSGENGQGIFFRAEGDDVPPPVQRDEAPPESKKPRSGPPSHLKLIK